jgi:hypothetical protein
VRLAPYRAHTTHKPIASICSETTALRPKSQNEKQKRQIDEGLKSPDRTNAQRIVLGVGVRRPVGNNWLNAVLGSFWLELQ